VLQFDFNYKKDFDITTKKHLIPKASAAR
jgi:hypothetical protein